MEEIRRLSFLILIWLLTKRSKLISPLNVIIFVIGGVTYSEAKHVNDLNKNNNGINYILGGTNILNSKIFLSDFITDKTTLNMNY